MPQDQILTCAECGTSFLRLAGEQSCRLDYCPMCQRLAPAPGRQRGLVKWFSRAKGYGFITSVAGPEIFLHKSGLVAGEQLPSAGQLVEFVVGRGPRGAQAEAVVALAANTE